MSQKHLNTIKEVAIKAGKLALSYQTKLSELNIKQKQAGDFVSQADINCELLIKEELNKEFKGFSFLGEETGLDEKESEYLWIIDPIDGTTNFIRGMKEYACAICLQEKGQTIASVVYFPALDELYYASRDKSGAFLQLTNKKNSSPKKLDISKKATLSESIISYGIGCRNIDKMSHIMKKLSPFSGGIRSFGACTVDIIRVAKGEFGAYIKPSIKKWDLHPSAYIAEKAGAGIYDIWGRETSEIENYSPEKDGCIIANKNIIAEIKEKNKATLDKSFEIAKEVYEDKICPLANKAVETSSPYVKEACKKSKPLLKSFLIFLKDSAIKSKPYLIKALAKFKELCIKSVPYIKQGAIYLKNQVIILVLKIKNRIKRK